MWLHLFFTFSCPNQNLIASLDIPEDSVKHYQKLFTVARLNKNPFLYENKFYKIQSKYVSKIFLSCCICPVSAKYKYISILVSHILQHSPPYLGVFHFLMFRKQTTTVSILCSQITNFIFFIMLCNIISH